MARKKAKNPETTTKRGPGRPKKVEAVEETPRKTPEQEIQERISRSNEEISAVLKKYNCDLEATILLKAGMVIPQIRIVPVEMLQRQMAGQPGPAPNPVQQ